MMKSKVRDKIPAEVMNYLCSSKKLFGSVFFPAVFNSRLCYTSTPSQLSLLKTFSQR